VNEIITKVCDKSGLEITNLEIEKESQEYEACRFELNGLKIISRTAKLTPKKAGQFVTFWKRNEKGPIEPFHDSDSFDCFIVNIKTEKGLGQFIFPKSVLIQRGIISTATKEGKRAFRVYTELDKNLNKTAERTRFWQQEFFVSIHESTNFKEILKKHSSYM